MNADQTIRDARASRSTGAGEPDDKALSTARRVLEEEAQGLLKVAASLGRPFLSTIDLVASIEGRVVVSGMGKSGHVGRKIAATLASVGTPAIFVHPAEASHGDLGMITDKDAVLAISNSGETAELKDLMLYTRRFRIPLIAMVGRAPSSLAEAADEVLLLPDLKEACPMGLAPTVSTTAMLALGDALAVSLLERAGFTASEFAKFHPGGKLGSQLLRVDALMHQGAELPTVEPHWGMSEVILEMTKKRLGCVGVVGPAGALLGIITDGDLRRHMDDRLFERRAADLMTADPLTIDARALAVEALSTMNERKVSVLFVVENDRPVGAIHVHDCIRAGIV